MAPKFRWINKTRCLQWIFILAKCKQIDIRLAVLKGIEHQDHHGNYRYCDNPQVIPDAELEQLQHEAELTLNNGGRVEILEVWQSELEIAV